MDSPFHQDTDFGPGIWDRERRADMERNATHEMSIVARPEMIWDAVRSILADATMKSRCEEMPTFYTHLIPRRRSSFINSDVFRQRLRVMLTEGWSHVMRSHCTASQIEVSAKLHSRGSRLAWEKSESAMSQTFLRVMPRHPRSNTPVSAL